MNKVYRTVFNEKTNTWIAVAETAKAHGKSGRSGGVVAAVADGMLLNKKMLTVSAAVAAAMAAQPAMADDARIENGSAQWTIAISPSNSTAGNGGAKATEPGSIAAGWDATAGHKWGVAIGYMAKTEGNNSLALGALAKAGTSTESDSWGTAVGYNAEAEGSGSPLAVGTYSKTLGESPIAIGDWATGEGDGAVAIGSKRYGQHLPGKATYAKGRQTVALGYLAQATQEKALALGANANASLANAVALGAGSLTNQNATQETQATVGGITYGAAAGQPAAFAGAANVQAGSQVSMGAAGSERQIKHVAPGAISADSTDAINGSQLHATQAVIGNLASTTASHLGGTVSVGADGKLTAPAYNVAGNTYNNVGAALGALDGAITNNKTHYYSVNSSEQAAGSNYNNDGATGTDALAAGVKAQAAQRNSIAIGNEAKVENSPANPSSSSIAIGDKAKAQGDLALAIGPGATVSGESAAGGIAIGSAATSNNGGMAVGSGANAGNGTPMIPGLPVRLNNNVALGDSALVKDDTNFRVALGSFSIAGESDLTAAPYKPTANANVAGIAGSGVELGEVSVGGDNTAGMGKILYRRVTNVAAGAADTDAVNVSQLRATNQNVAKGINFGGTTGSNNYQLGDTINVKGDRNITSTTENGGVQLGLNPNLNVTSVTATDAAGNQTVTNGGVTITPAAGGNPVSLTTGGLNNGGNKITNVAPGEISATSTDAVNGSQLHNAINNSVGNVAGAVENLQNRMGKLQDDSEAGTASALAAAGLPQAYLPGKSMIAVSGSTYRGQQGYAVGMSAISDSGNWIVKGTAAGNSRGHFGVTIGAGYQW